MTEPSLPNARFPAQELTRRIVSAAVLAAATLAVTWIGSWPFSLLVIVVAAIIAWEWGRLMRGADLDPITLLSVAGIVPAIALAAAGLPALALGALVVTALAVWVVGGEDEGRIGAAGVASAGLPAVALVWLRADPGHGLTAIVLLLVVVWSTDTGAFIAGRAVGGPRLMPSISPNKTWSGLAGGVIAACLAGWLVAVWVSSPAPWRVLASAVALAVISQAGDLVESALKRSHGVKDTSQLIPGHGGFMDRVDGLVFAAVAAAAWALIVNPAAPGGALLGLP